jgi:hypothetical protein
MVRDWYLSESETIAPARLERLELCNVSLACSLLVKYGMTAAQVADVYGAGLDEIEHIIRKA